MDLLTNLKNLNQRILLGGSLILIIVLFLVVSILTYTTFSKNLIQNEMYSQIKMANIINQLLNRYFDTLKFITESSASLEGFRNEDTYKDDHLRYIKLDNTTTSKLAKENNIQIILKEKAQTKYQKQMTASEIGDGEFFVWQIFKGLPEQDVHGRKLARKRREYSDNILKNYKDIHYVFEMDENGDLIFLEPFSVQKNITSFNYIFRDYLKQVINAKQTATSEGYISHDMKRTQIITIGSPIFDKSGKVIKVFAASVTGDTLRTQIFGALKKILDVHDYTSFYLIDRHGHIVASSSGKDIYFPLTDKTDDNQDEGNIRNIGIFKNIAWEPDILEKGNIWERSTKSWRNLQPLYTGEYENTKGIKVFGTFLPIKIGNYGKINWGVLIETPIDQLFASRAYLNKVFYLSGILLILILVGLFVLIIKNFKRLEEKIVQKQKEITKITSQTSHDIKSPLVALNMAVDDLSQLPEDKRILIKSAVTRIHDIANNLLIQYGSKETHAKHGEINSELIASLLESIVSEKRVLYMKDAVTINLDIEQEAYCAFAMVGHAEFKRAISNLINNAVEATNMSGKVNINLKKRMEKLLLEIIDDGCGMDLALIPKITAGGVTVGKKNGSGLGFSFAMEKFELWDCKVDVDSTINVGTRISIAMPTSKPAKWFGRQLTLIDKTTVVVLDDDNSVYGVWKKRLSEFVENNQIKLERFTTPEEALEWHNKNKEYISAYLVDYELIGSELNGIDFIKALGIHAKSILVTSHFEEYEIRSQCNQQGIKSIPKDYALHIPLNVVSREVDMIFIDDNETLTQAWACRGALVGKQVAVFNDAQEFLNVLDLFDKETPIYIDSELGDSRQGEDYARAFFDRGFENLYLATGKSMDCFKNCFWIKGVVTKEFPFEKGHE